jgi:hypothetical protein|tara:strand:+ start:291 stop:521 length:231 start_codon:yes stop_codon:yes gene_type:complete
MLEGLQDRLRLALVQVKIDDGMPYWKYVDIVLDFGNVSFEQAALAHYVLFKTELPESRDTISWHEVDSALTELEAE